MPSRPYCDPRFLRQMAQFLGVTLLSCYFLYQAYEIFFNKEKWASSFYSAYGNFESYYNKQIRSALPNELAYKMPD